MSEESRETFWRSLQTLNATRITIIIVLLLYLTFDKGTHSAGPFVYTETCIVYLILAICFGMVRLFHFIRLPPGTSSLRITSNRARR